MENKVTHEYINQWLENLKLAWINKDFDIVESLFKKCSCYIEAPFITPLGKIEDIKNIWNEVNHHSNVQLHFDIILFSRNKAIVNYFAEYFNGTKDQKSNGIYVIEYNQSGECVSFAQWSVIAP